MHTYLSLPYQNFQKYEQRIYQFCILSIANHLKVDGYLMERLRYTTTVIYGKELEIFWDLARMIPSPKCRVPRLIPFSRATTFFLFMILTIVSPIFLLMDFWSLYIYADGFTLYNFFLILLTCLTFSPISTQRLAHKEQSINQSINKCHL